LAGVATSRIAGAAGLLALAASVVGVLFEAGFPDTRDAAVLSQFVLDHKDMLLRQSVAFSLSPALLMFLIAGLKTRIARSEGSTFFGDAAFGAGIIWLGLQIAAQCLQVGFTLATTSDMPLSMGAISSATAMLTLSGIVGAAFLGATGAGILVDRQMPVWFGMLSLVAALAQMLIWMTAVVESGPFSPVGWTACVLQPFFVVWLVPASFLMLRDRPHSAEAP